MTERSPSLEQAVVEACRFGILDHVAFLGEAKSPLNANRRGGGAPFGFAKESRPPRATVSGMDVEAPSGGERFDTSTTNIKRSVAEVVGVFRLIRFCRGSSVARGNLRLDPELQMPSLTRKYLGPESA
jgi:hypothetical protein